MRSFRFDQPVVVTNRVRYSDFMLQQSFSDVDTWVFDLDNTLYPPHMCLFNQIEVRMISYVMSALGVDRESADYLRGHYWKTHGTTLAGLMREHDIDPVPYLIDVHDIDFTVLAEDPALNAAIQALPGRKIIYTNGTAPYAQNVTNPTLCFRREATDFDEFLSSS